MRSIGSLTLVAAAALMLAAGCGDNGGTPPDNQAPTANFAVPSCTIHVPCAFSSTSTDDAAVTAWTWDFDGDGTADASTANASFTAGEFDVRLTVQDAEGLTGTMTQSITIAPVDPTNDPPTAGFTYTCDGTACSFTSTSTDPAPGTIASYAWNFGDGGTDEVANPTHTFGATQATDYTVTLTVADDGGATASDIQTVHVVPGVANTPPTAGFTVSCDHAQCSFTSTSSDAAPGSIASYAWDFGDTGSAQDANPTHLYNITVPTSVTVTLTVTDNEGATDSDAQTFTVNPPNTPPTAGFTFDCNGLTCSFTSTSTDAAPGSIASFAWTFGDGASSNAESPTHSYNVVAATDFTVKLTVTDNDGSTDDDIQTVRVTPPAPGAEGCTRSGTNVDCLLNVTSESTIKLKLLGVSCTLNGQRVTAPAPIGDQVFLNVCSKSVGDSTKIFGGPADTAIVYLAGSQVKLRFSQGTAGAGDPAPAPPQAQLVGSFPNWTINFEDGDHSGDPGEPDFSDVILGVEAVPHP